MMKCCKLTCVGILSLGLLVIPGCGGEKSGVQVKGTVVDNGQPLSLTDQDYILIELSSADGKSYTGQLNKDGSFAIENEEGVPPGKYKVTMTSQTENPIVFGGKFAEGVSTLEVTVEDGKEELDPIDIAK